MDEKSKKDMTGFFQGLINKGNNKKITERKPPGGSSALGAGKLPSLDPSIIGNNGLANGMPSNKNSESSVGSGSFAQKDIL